MNKDELILSTEPHLKKVAHYYAKKNRDLDVADILQVARLGAVKAAATWREGQGSSFTTWAILYAKGEIRQWYGVENRHRTVELRGELPAEDVFHPVEQAVDVDLLMARLSERQRHVLHQFLADQSFKEISLELGLSYQSTRALFWDAVAECRASGGIQPEDTRG